MRRSDENDGYTADGRIRGRRHPTGSATATAGRPAATAVHSLPQWYAVRRGASSTEPLGPSCADAGLRSGGQQPGALVHAMVGAYRGGRPVVRAVDGLE